MNAESKDIKDRLASELASFDDQLETNAGDVQLLARIQTGISRLVKASGGSEAGIRRVLQEQYEAGELRKETFQLIKSMLDRFVTEQIPTEPTVPPAGGPSLDAVSAAPDDIFASTTVINQDDLPATAPDERVQVGSVLRDRFMLQKRISGGSMGVVYKALDRRLAETGEVDHWVAIKVLSPQLARNGNALRALQQEAAKGRNLAHPNIVRFIDFDRDDDLYFLVMEWLEGRTLAEILDTPGTKKLDIDEALEIVRQVGRALEYAHRCGIVHADVKPGNIMIQRDGTAKLFDFGVARVWQQTEAAGRQSGADFDPTVLGAMTPAYSSMQVITGDIPTPADDVFSLACLLYRLIAGYRVFGPRNAAEACEEGMKPQPLPGLSKQQWEAVHKALSYSRVTRFDSMSAFLDALNATSIEKIAAEPRGNVHSEEPADVGRWMVGLAAVLIIAGFAAFELGFLDQWLPKQKTTTVDVVAPTEPANPPATDTADTVPEGAMADEPVTELPAEEPDPEPVEFVEPEPDTSSEPVVVVPVSEPEGEASDAVLPAEVEAAVADLVAEPAPPLEPADFEISLDRSGIEQAINIRLREDEAPLTVDLIRLGSLASSLRVRLEEVDYSGNRSPLQTGQYRLSNDGIVVFEVGAERARLEMVMASDPLREADQQSTLKVRAVEGDSSGLAHIDVSLEDDDQRAFERLLSPDTIGFAVSQMSVGERDPAVQVDIVRYNPSSQALIVNYSVSTITASEGEDFFPPADTTVLFAPGQRSARLLIPLVQDSQYEGDEAFVVELVSGVSESTPGDVYQRIAIMIRDDDPPPRQR